MSKKPFKETKVGAWLKKNAPKVLDVVGDVTGIDALKKVSDLIVGEDMPFSQRLELQKLIAEQESELLKAELENVKSARDREVGVVTATGKPDYMQWAVGTIGLIISGVVVYVGLFHEIQDREIYFHLLGVVEGAILLSIFNYYFGSSLGSKNKDKRIGDIMK